MSGHLIGCAGALEHLPGQEHLDKKDRAQIPTSHKLALLAFADSADDRTHIGFPGEAGVMKWAVCSRGRAYELIRDLVEWGLLELYKRGRRGQRAEYIVFPGGCCELHRPVEENPPDVDPESLAAAAGVSVEQARRMLAALADDDVVQAHDPQAAAPLEGSDAPDTESGTVSGLPDANQAVVHTDPAEPVENTPAGPRKGPVSVHASRSNANAFTPSKRIPPPPTFGQGSCVKHPNGHASCRACGTSPRAAAKVAGRAAAAAARDLEQKRIRAQRARDKANQLPSDDPTVQARLDTVREQLDEQRRTSQDRRAG